MNAVTAAIVLLCTHMVYETNDDFAISSRIADGYPEVYFINYYYCLLLTKIQAVTSVLNVHVVAQVVLSFVSFVCILKLVLDNARERIAVVSACALILFFSIDHYTTIQFTKTAALATIAGSVLLIDALIKRRHLFYYGAGAFLFLLGACIRIEGVIIAFGFAGIYVLSWMVENRYELKEVLSSRAIAFGLIMVVIVGGSAALHMASMKANARTPELENYVKYNELRTAVIDFSILDSYEEQKQKYDEAGLSENDIILIKSWMFDYDGAASSENLESIIKIGDGDNKKEMSVKKAIKQFIKGVRSSMKTLTPKGAQIIVLILLGVWLIIAGKGSVRLFVFLTGLATIALHIMMYYIGRPAYRAFYVPNVCAAIVMLYMLSELEEIRKPKKYPGVLVILAMVLLVIPVYKDAVDTYNANSNRIMSKEFAEHINSNKDDFFVVGTREKKQNPSYIVPWKKPDTRLESNCMGTGSWGTMSPYILNKLASYGMENPIRDTLYNPNAYYVGNKNVGRMEEYYNKWYPKKGQTVRMVKKDEVDGMGVWKPLYE